MTKEQEMSTRSAFRMKVVLPVTVIRNDRSEKQLAHTLDITSDSARLGGLYLPVEPGELIDLQRGRLRAKFYVFWVGAPNTMLAGQAGVRGLVPKSMWGVEIPDDTPDPIIDTQNARTGLPLVRAAHASTDRRWQTRHACQGGAVVRAAGLSHPMYAQVSDISASGVYLETPSVLPPNTELQVRMNIEGITMEVAAMVKSTDPSMGMGISFQKLTPENQERLGMALRYLQARASQTAEGLHGYSAETARSLTI
jgi:hypothetical protein